MNVFKASLLLALTFECYTASVQPDEKLTRNIVLAEYVYNVNGLGRQLYSLVNQYEFAKQIDAELIYKEMNFTYRVNEMWQRDRQFREDYTSAFNMTFDRIVSVEQFEEYSKKKIVVDHDMFLDIQMENKGIYDSNFKIYTVHHDVKDINYIQMRKHEYKEQLHILEINYFNDRFMKMFNQIRSTPNSVAVHARVVAKEEKLSLYYYQKSMQYFREIIKNPAPTFFIFSDDIQFTEMIYEMYSQEKGDIVIAADDSFTNLQDLYLQRQTEHFILGNCLHNFWAGFQGSRRGSYVIRPSEINPKTNEEVKKYFALEWMPIESKTTRGSDQHK